MLRDKLTPSSLGTGCNHEKEREKNPQQQHTEGADILLLRQAKGPWSAVI